MRAGERCLALPLQCSMFSGRCMRDGADDAGPGVTCPEAENMSLMCVVKVVEVLESGCQDVMAPIYFVTCSSLHPPLPHRSSYMQRVCMSGQAGWELGGGAGESRQ